MHDKHQIGDIRKISAHIRVHSSIRAGPSRPHKQTVDLIRFGQKGDLICVEFYTIFKVELTVSKVIFFKNATVFRFNF